MLFALVVQRERHAPVQVIHDARQAEAGACALRALIEHEPGFAVARQQAADRRVVRPLLRQ
jgi:hypothetical protein